MCINYLELQATQIMENIVYIIIKIRCTFVTSSTWFKTISLVFGPSTHREYREQNVHDCFAVTYVELPGFLS